MDPGHGSRTDTMSPYSSPALMSFLVDVIPNHTSPPAILFRCARHEGKHIHPTALALAVRVL